MKTAWINFSSNPLKILAVFLICFAGGYFLGLKKEVPTRVEVRTVESTELKEQLRIALETQESLRSQLSIAQKTIADVKTNTVETVRIVYLKDGSTTIDKTKTTTTDSKIEDSKNVQKDDKKDKNVDVDVDRDTDLNENTETETITTTPSKSYYVGITSGVSLTGFHSPGLEFKYRLFDIGNIGVWTGAEVQTNVPFNGLNGTQFRIGVGVSF